jgi:hypothetical protein
MVENGSLNMKTLMMQSLAICILLLLTPTSSFSQQRNKIIACKGKAFTALKPLPDLTYRCPPDAANESDDSILKSPERINAINKVVRKLKSFTSPDWWESAVGDLNACYLRGKPGVLSQAEREQFTGEEYQVRLLGNNRIRVVVTPDPCYQTYYNGANAFILYRQGTKVYITEAINGYYSRLEKSLSLKLFRLNAEQVIEIETVNISGMRPETSAYYFVIDKATNKAIPKELVRRGRRLTLQPLRK